MNRSWQLIVGSWQRTARRNFLHEAGTAINSHAGFTLIELMVTVGIMVVISGVMLINHAQFGGNVILQNLAYDLGLSIRQAQVFGISVRRNDLGSPNFNAGYGMHFDSGSPASYMLYGDVGDGTQGGSPNGRYDYGEMVNTVNIRSGYYIKSLCSSTIDAQGKETETCGATRLDILFVRPEPDAWISVNGSNCVPGGVCQSSARIIISSPRGATMSVSVSANGQIAVQQNITNP